MTLLTLLLACVVVLLVGVVAHLRGQLADVRELSDTRAYTIVQLEAKAHDRFTAEYAALKLDTSEAEDAKRFRWLNDHGMGFTHETPTYGISTARWGAWPDDNRKALDMVRMKAGRPKPKKRKARK